MWKKKREEKDYLCIQEHCPVVSSATVGRDTKETANVGNRRLSRQLRKTTGDGGESARLVVLTTRQNTALTFWPLPSHMKAPGNEPITLADADELQLKAFGVLMCIA